MGISTYSTNGVTVEFYDNSPQVLAALKSATRRGLEACGAMAESYAKQELSRPKPHADGSVRPNVITGRLRNSISHDVIEQGEGSRMVVGTNVEYGPYLELGTRKMQAYPYLKPAVTEHTDEYRNILKDSLQNA